MKDIINKQKILFVSLILLVVISLTLMTTYAYQTLGVNVKNGSSDEVKIKAGVLDISFLVSRRINITNMPLLDDYTTSDYIEFSVNNANSTEDVRYKVLLSKLEYSDALKTEDFKYTLVRVDGNDTNVIGEGDFKDLINDEYELSTNYGKYIYIKKGEKQTLRLYLWLKESNNNQNYLKKSYFKGILEIDSFFSKDIVDKIITNFKVYGSSETLGTLIEDTNSENYQKYEIILKSMGVNKFKSNELFIKDGNNWVYQELYLDSGVYTINYNTNIFNGMMVKDNNDNIIIDKTSIGEINIINSGIYKIYIGDLNNNYVFSDNVTPDIYQAMLVNNNYDISKYEPSNDEEYKIYLNQPLKCINNVCDYIDFIDNKVNYITDSRVEPINSINITKFIDKNIVVNDGVHSSSKILIEYNK